MTRIHIFKPGSHTDSGGHRLEFTEADLAQAASVYDPALHEAPLVVGHPKHDLPAYGWVSSLEFDDTGLHALPTQVDASFSEIVTEGRYKHISASFYVPDAPNNPVPGSYYLRHVGFLGAAAPAVKGLKAIEFAEDEEGVVEFQDALPLGVFARLFRGLRDFIIDTNGTEAADRVISPWDVEELERQAARQDADRGLYTEAPAPAAPAAPAEAPAAPDAGAAPEPTDAERLAERDALHAARQAELDAREQAIAEREAAREAEEQRLAAEATAADQRRQAEAERAARRAEAASFAESLGGRLLPRERDVVVAALAELGAGQTVNFGEEAGGEQPLAGELRAVLSRLPVEVDYAERSAAPAEGEGAGTVDFAAPPGHTVDNSRLALHSRALAHQAAHAGTSYLDAVKAVGG